MNHRGTEHTEAAQRRACMPLFVQSPLNPEGVRQATNPFRVWSRLEIMSQGSRLRSNSGLKLANASGVFIQIQTYALPKLDAMTVKLRIFRPLHSNEATRLACLAHVPPAT